MKKTEEEVKGIGQGEEQVEEIDKEEELNEIACQSALSTNWVEGLMQRIQQSLMSNTPLIMCEKDLDELNFLLLTSGCADPKTVLAAVEKLNEEVNKEGKDSEIKSEKVEIEQERESI